MVMTIHVIIKLMIWTVSKKSSDLIKYLRLTLKKYASFEPRHSNCIHGMTSKFVKINVQ